MKYYYSPFITDDNQALSGFLSGQLLSNAAEFEPKFVWFRIHVLYKYFLLPFHKRSTEASSI